MNDSKQNKPMMNIENADFCREYGLTMQIEGVLEDEGGKEDPLKDFTEEDKKLFGAIEDDYENIIQDAIDAVYQDIDAGDLKEHAFSYLLNSMLCHAFYHLGGGEGPRDIAALDAMIAWGKNAADIKRKIRGDTYRCGSCNKMKPDSSGEFIRMADSSIKVCSKCIPLLPMQSCRKCSKNFPYVSTGTKRADPRKCGLCDSIKKIKVIDYPATFTFKTDVKLLPKFKYGCKVRDAILLEQLKNQKIASPNHEYEDYTVEKVVKTHDGGENWYLGS